MKRLLLFALVSASAWGQIQAGIVGASSAGACAPTSNFPGSVGDSLGTVSGWTLTAGGGLITLDGAGGVYPHAASTTSLAYMGACTLTNATVTVTVVSTSSSGYIGPAGRLQASPSLDGYRCVTNGTSTFLQTADGLNNIGSSGAGVAAGHTLSLVMSGTSLKCQDNGVDITGPSGTDSTYTAAGFVGVGAFANDSGMVVSTFTAH